MAAGEGRRPGPENPKEPVRAMAAQMREVQESHTQKTVLSEGCFLPQGCREKAGKVQRGSRAIKRMEELVHSKHIAKTKAPKGSLGHLYPLVTSIC